MSRQAIHELELIVFNVSHGLSVALIERPENYVTLIDLGASDEVSPLEPEEWELITPLWWAGLIDGACQSLAQGVRDDGWIMRKLLQRSPLMGAAWGGF